MTLFKVALPFPLMPLALSVCAQLPSVTYVSADEAASILVGQNVLVSNATFSGDSRQLALFTNGTAKVGIGDGIVLTTGMADFAALANDNNPAGQSWPTLTDQNSATAYNAEPDLNSINGAGGVRNPAVLEFDFSTSGQSIELQYVFASKEYLEWVWSNYNDAIGFFISGPGINGGFLNNAVNIALVDGLPVSVNTIHPLDPTNGADYVDTPLGAGQFAYDGRSIVLSSTLPVQCNARYHAKLAICNTADFNFPSAVFIKAGTLTSPYSPPGPLSVEPTPACEGTPIILTVGGEPTWTYMWSTGQNGVGLQEVTTTASTGIDSYSVSAEYLPGCTLQLPQLQGRVLVHTANNVQPTCPGGDVYVQAEDWLTFDIPSADSPNEEVTMQRTGGDAGGTFTVVDLNAPQWTGHYVWQPSEMDIGWHTLEITVTDNNACGVISGTCVYNVKVLCRYCPTCVYYENRSPGGLPLPEITRAGACIVAGTNVDDSQTNGPVSTGSASVTFRAPTITLEPGFTAGPGFVAAIDLDACAENCEECCEEGAGIRIEEPLPNVMTPNSDGVNDYWQALDQQHPYCAYNANFFDLWIYNSWGGEVVAHRTGQGYCCPFVSKAPGVNVVSSINWDGRADGGLFCSGCFVPDGVYYYVLEVEGNCGGSADYAGYIHVFGSPGMEGGGEGMILEQEELHELVIAQRSFVEEIEQTVLRGGDKDVVIQRHSGIQVYPNPTNGKVTIQSSTAINSVEVRETTGRRLLQEQPHTEQFTLDLGCLASGSYTLAIQSSSGSWQVERIVKQ